ncbi:hypothetical protein BOX15_Mlig031225g1 [Macrostomum lignano]|uniref:Uncharacterized protein n=1 Tax=Macrostomum lignano TaxID=282301 RepID=A0A267G2X8_9PLAT|nr:hypothetical protein BOX15_Mlig031225g1 [Macrostomum lignano]
MVKAGQQQRQSTGPSESSGCLPRVASSTSLSSLASSAGAGGGNGKAATSVAKPEPPTEEAMAHAAFIGVLSPPTHLYRYLAMRHRTSPIFLTRSLSYIGRPVGRSGSRSLAESTAALAGRPVAAPPELPAETPAWDLPRNASLELRFAGFFDSNREKEWVTVSARLDLAVVHRCYNRRKSTRSSGQRHLACLSLECNPYSRTQRPHRNGHGSAGADSEPPADFTVLNKDLRDPQANRIVQSYLLLRVSAMEKRNYSKMYDSPPGARKSHKKDVTEYPVQYCAVLPLFNHGRAQTCTSSGTAIDCPLQLYTGEYECRLECLGAEEPADLVSASARVLQEWHGSRIRPASAEASEYERWPVVRFSARWTGVTGEPAGAEALQQPPQAEAQAKEEQLQQKSRKRQHSGTAKQSAGSKSGAGGDWRVIYNFYHAGRCRQCTEVDGLRCPWCDLDCRQANGLLCHLRACHSRLAFASISETSAVKRRRLLLEVRINSDYNGGYEGDPACLFRSTGFEPTPFPARRLPFTHLIHWRGAACSAQQTLVANPRPLVSGHTRQYFHSQTCVPLLPQEIDADSEDEIAPDWLRQKYSRNLEDFTDVNEGEKAVMMAWNLHVMTWEGGPVTGQHQLPQLCSTFIDRCAPDLLARGLRGNLLLHLASLTDYGLVRPDLLYELLLRVNQLAGDQPQPMAVDA